MTDARDTKAFSEILCAVTALQRERLRYVENIFRSGGMPDPARVRILVALDGRCGAGKTTLATAVAEELNRGTMDTLDLVDLLDALGFETTGRPLCEVVHMDDFFLRPEERTPERLATPGENVDHERFLAEVLTPLRAGKAAEYRPFDCSTSTLSDALWVHPVSVALVEGSYACHPALRRLYDRRLFLTVSPEEQWARIRRRNGEEGAEAFRTRWIPMEEAYITACGVEAACEGLYTVE